ncbi:hypothetical protein POTOM_037751 [Populus tomentosa]|uniref:NAB domain-containing protein n=1 Tax=Populus tomentosa TaxID=118781 RepID=A0A8X7YUH3_POPTO|nr:hypothetical protein POTOM_037751 [Populus tomentosa]
MYYKKRPELMKLVEEFYRAYRALAERYDHATVELRQAHRTMAEAFPNQVSYAPDGLHRDSFGLSMERNGGYPEESDSGINKKGLKQLDELFMSREAASRVSKVADGKMKKGLKVHEAAETEVQILKKALSEIQTEKERCSSSIPAELAEAISLERELKDVGGERDAGLLQYNKCLERISALENVISQTEEDSKGLNARAIKAEIEAQHLKQELAALEAEKEAGLLQYTNVFNSMMESEIFNAQEDVNRLNSEILTGAAKLKNVEEQCFLLERSNHSLQSEAENLAQKISTKDQELSEKENELEKLQASLQDEQSRFILVEATLQTLQKLHSQSQEEQKAWHLSFKIVSNLEGFGDIQP